MAALPIKVFISHSHEDTSWAERLRVRIGASSEGALDVWSDARLGSGGNWRARLEQAIRTANLIVVLLSPDYVLSSFVSLVELPLILSRGREGAAAIIPIVLRPIQLPRESPLWRWQFVNLPDRPLVSLGSSDLDHLFEHVAIAMGEYARDRSRLASAGRPGQSLLDQLAGRVATMVAARHDSQISNDRRAPGSRLIFAIMPYTDDMEPIFEGVRAAASAVGLEAKRVKDIVGDYRIADKILELIIASRLIVADLTHERPNVYFELGYARGLGKTVITIARNDTQIHFDVKDWTFLPYIDSRVLERNLVERFRYELERDM
jgi:hypothetical protein